MCRVVRGVKCVSTGCSRISVCPCSSPAVVLSYQAAILGSPEGAFDNVKLNFSGDQGQVMKQLLSSFAIHRVAMCCVSGGQGKKQHLAVSHDKGKFAILQLSALLKQTDSNKRKLTLTVGTHTHTCARVNAHISVTEHTVHKSGNDPPQ